MQPQEGNDCLDTETLMCQYEALDAIAADKAVGPHTFTRTVLEKCLVLIWVTLWDKRVNAGFENDQVEEKAKEFVCSHKKCLTGERKFLSIALLYGPVLPLLCLWRLDTFRNHDHCAPSSRAHELFYQQLINIERSDGSPKERLVDQFDSAYESLLNLLHYTYGAAGKDVAWRLMTVVYGWDLGSDNEDEDET